MPICPECKGKKTFKIPSDHPLDVYKIDGPVVYKEYQCYVCDGVGTISRLKLAVYRARGGGPPPTMKGYA